MKISTDTLQILKNFASINKGIHIKPGNKLLTLTDHLVAEAVITEEFPIDVGIYDLSQLLNIASLLNDPEFDFGSDCLRIADATSEVLYAYASSGMVSVPHPKKKKELPSDIIEFTLTEEQWSRIQKAASALGREEVKITSNGKVVHIGTANVKGKGSSGNSFSTALDADPHGLSCNMVYTRTHMPLLKGSYAGVVTSMYTMFKNTAGFDLTYYIGFEPTTSTFGSNEDE